MTGRKPEAYRYRYRVDGVFRKAYKLQKDFKVSIGVVVLYRGRHYVYRSSENFWPSMEKIVRPQVRFLCRLYPLLTYHSKLLIRVLCCLAIIKPAVKAKPITELRRRRQSTGRRVPPPNPRHSRLPCTVRSPPVWAIESDALGLYYQYTLPSDNSAAISMYASSTSYTAS